MVFMCQGGYKVDHAMACWMKWEVRFHDYQRKCPWFYIRLVNWTYSVSPEDTALGSTVEDFAAVVRGGSSESITALVSKKLPTPQLMSLWGDGVRFNPDFIRTTVSFSFTNSCKFHFCLFVFLSCMSLLIFIQNLFRDLTSLIDAHAE